MKIKQYETKDGNKRYILKGAYLGTDSLTGEQVRTTVRGKSEREVRRKYELKIREFEDGGSTKKKKLDIKKGSELIDMWLEYYIDSGIRASTYNVISYKINKHIRPLIGNDKLDELTPRLMSIKVAKFKKDIKGKLKDYDTVLAYMRTILQYGVDQEFLQSNPMSNIKTGKDKKDKSTEKKDKKLRHYDKEQISHIFTALESYTKTGSINDVAFATYIKVLLFTGARVNEILALNWSDINFNKRTMTIDKTISNEGKDIETPKTDAGIRTIELDEMTVSVLKNWRRILYEKCLQFGIKKPNVVFYNISKQNNYRYTSLKARYKTYCKNNDIPYLGGLHAFRHTHATMYVASGGDFKTLQARLGHEDITMTMNLYAKSLPEIERKAVDKAILFMTT